MMKTAIMIYVVAIGFFPLAGFSDEAFDIPDELVKTYEKANNIKSYSKERALPVFKELYTKEPNSFTATYSYARLLVQLERFEEAIPVLRAAINLRDRKHVESVTVQNTMGFALLKIQEFEKALLLFKVEKSLPSFEGLPVSQRMKVFNNTGVALLSLDRYEEATREFEAASALGSRFADQNINIVNSTISALENSDVDSPGVFVTVLYDSPIRKYVESKRQEIAGLLGRNIDDFSVFLDTNEFYKLTLGNNLSYPKANLFLKEARNANLHNAYVGSRTSWKEMTSQN